MLPTVKYSRDDAEPSPALLNDVICQRYCPPLLRYPDGIVNDVPVKPVLVKTRFAEP